MLRDAVAITSGPSAVRFARGAARHVSPTEVGSGLKARLVREGAGDVCILAVGKMLAAAEEAGAALDATVWDVRVVKPLDVEMLRSAAGHRLVVTIEDGIRVGGVGMQIMDAIADLDESRVSPPVVVLGLPASFIPQGKPDHLLASLGLDAGGIVAAAEKALAATRTSLD